MNAHENSLLGDRIGGRLVMELDAHDASSVDLARLIDVSSSAVSKWMMNTNAVSYINAQAVAFVLGLTVNNLSNTNDFPRPERTRGCDYEELSRNIIDVVSRDRIKSHTLAIDAKRRAEAYLAALEPKVLKSFEELAIITQSAPAPKDYTPGPRQAVPVVPHIPEAENADRNRVLLMLKNLERLRQDLGLEWTIKEDGSLGAQRVTVETF